MTDTRISQVGLEAWINRSPEAQFSQVGLEVWGSSAVATTEARISQIGLEVWALVDGNRRRLVNVYLL